MKKPGKKLVIVESPAKARTLEKFLGRDFVVAASSGHVRDLPPKSLGVKVDKDFEPNYQVIKGKEKIISELKTAAKKAEVVFLAPDPDREGEAIAWHLKALLGVDSKVKRIEFHEITKEAVTAAVKHPRDIDLARVNAQQARRILDRLVGFKLSPLLWKKVRKGLSAGRVQSVAVRLICEREELVNKFKSEEYWDILAQLTNRSQAEFSAKLVAEQGSPIAVSPKEKGQVIRSQAEAQALADKLAKAAYRVDKVIKKEHRRYPSPPFITSTLQQEASRKLGYSAKRTMMIAQKLYEGVDLKDQGPVGLITYMRTDSVRIAASAEAEARKYIAEQLGQQYLPPQPVRYKKKKSAQDAHEAIRPTGLLRHPDKIKDSLRPEEYKLYELIWRRFVACQMEAAVHDQTSIEISAAEYAFRASGSVLKFDGFMTLYLEDDDNAQPAEPKSGQLPSLEEGETLQLIKLLPEQHFTEPPPRYTEASLVKELEEKGIGRPSTYAPIISTITDRGYITKEGKALKPAEIGMITNQLLVKHFPKILDVKFTAHLEDELDDVVEGKMDWIETLKEFYVPFAESLAQAEIKMEKVKKEIKTDELCPKCGKPLVIRQSRYGDFMACSGYPKCKFTKPIAGSKEDAVAQAKCEKCGQAMVLKSSRFGNFWACSGYPQCKNIRTILKKIGVKCPRCATGELVEKRTRRGKFFYGCSNYPDCDFATWQKPVDGQIKGEESA